MTFTSPLFLYFFIACFCLTFINKNRVRLSNLIILAFSYTFYAWWDWRFVFLILFSTLSDYFIALAMQNSAQSNRKKFVVLSVIINLSVLGFFKYFNFFLNSLNDVLMIFNTNASDLHLNIILPVGISFYTFQSMSYTIDVYRGKIKAHKDFISFAAFISFFPQLVAGPIERATRLLPQFTSKREITKEKISSGFREILYGCLKKVVFADTFAQYVNTVFADYESASGSELILATLFFGLQIYCDFSAYSNIARGTARILGFELMHNFLRPYFASGISQFWERWHISLSTWFRDYVYIPLGGNRKGNFRKIFNISVVFLVSGLWHGANWTFVVWGGVHAILYYLEEGKRLLSDRIAIFGSIGARTFWQIFVFIGVMYAWVFFRAESIDDAFKISAMMVDVTNLKFHPTMLEAKYYLGLTAALFLIEALPIHKRHDFDVSQLYAYVRWPLYLIVGFAILALAAPNEEQFIYFQF